MAMKIVALLALFCSLCWLDAAQGGDRPIDGISDNSFLIEEAYNQDAGVIQHIFEAIYTNDSRHLGWAFSFTQEWPLFSESHQFSYTIPWTHLREEGERQNGINDVMLNYRYQALDEETHAIAFAPRFSLILPTGDRRRGTGDGAVGYQWNLPFSKKISSRVALHANLGLTYQPHVRAPLDLPGSPLSRHRTLLSYNLGASAIYALHERFNFMLEWLGTSEQSIDGEGKRQRAFKPFLSPGFRAAVIDSNHLQSVVGVGFPVGLARRTENYGVLFYLSLEHKFL
jgi:Putative MetA-pathway of phenol degradation